MKVLFLALVILMPIYGCKFSYQKTHLAEVKAVSPGVYLNTKICLESAFSNDTSGLEMSTTLNEQNLIPSVTPFQAAPPWYHYSPNNLSLTPDILDPDGSPLTVNDRIFVDWVLVEIFQEVNGVKKFIDSQSALIHFDGTIYDTSGFQGILFPGLSDGQYFINIIHRNHLAVGSAESIALSSSFNGTIYDIDFTSMSTEYLGESTLPSPPFIIPLGPMGSASTTKCLLAGDLNGSLSIDALDEDEITTNISYVVASPAPDVAILGYLNSDLSFNGQSQRYTDLTSSVRADDSAIIHDNIGAQGSIHFDE
jgi:hypothetical protein